MDRVGCQAHLCMMYVVGLLNHLTNSKGYIPKTVLAGEVMDVSLYLAYHFWQEIFVEDPKGGKQLAYWCSPSEKQGDFLTYNILLRDTKQLVQRSNVCPVKDSLFPNHNQHHPPANGDTMVPIRQPVIQTVTDLSLNTFLQMNSLACLLSANTMDAITALRSYKRFLIVMLMTIRRSNSSYPLETVNSKNYRL